MAQNFKKYFAITLLLAVLVLPSFAQASWYNPFSWGIWQKIGSIFHKQEIAQVQPVIKNKEKLLLEDVYPLYGSVNWLPATPKKSESVEPLDGLEVKAETKTNGFTDAEKFFIYYKDKLTKLGWADDSNFSADGVLGSQIGFKKGDGRIVLGFSIKPGKVISSQNEPLRYECPCQTTFSVFTATKIDETAGWKTYTNTEYGFEFKYPVVWEIYENVDKERGDFKVMVYPDFKKEKFSVSLGVDTPPLAFGSFEKYKKTLIDGAQSSSTYFNSKEIIIDGKNAFVVDSKTSFNYLSESISIFNNGNIYGIGYSGQEELGNKYKNEYDKILNSFKFTK